MGMSASKVVNTKLTNSSELKRACDSVFIQCLNLTRHSFDGLLPYQLATATNLLHSTLISNALIGAWLPLPPTRLHIHTSLRLILSRRRHRRHRPAHQNQNSSSSITESPEEFAELVVIGPDEFKDFAVEVFTCAVVDSAKTEVLNRVKVGVGGILGVGILTRSEGGLVGAASGAYALFVATSVYLALSA